MLKKAKKHEGEKTPVHVEAPKPQVLTPQPAPSVVAAPQTVPVPMVAEKKYRVKARAKVSFHGQMTTLQAGDIITNESYGPDAEAWLKDHHVEYEEAK